jgi:hypothetical protein
VDLELGRPCVLGDDFHVDGAVVRLPGAHSSGLQETERPEIALGLGQPLRVVGVPFPKQEEAPDHGGLCLDVEGVGGAVDPAAPFFLRGVDVQALNADLSDPERFVRPRDTRDERERQKESPRQVPSSQEPM